MDEIREKLQTGLGERLADRFEAADLFHAADRFPAMGRVEREGFVKPPVDERDPGQADPRPNDGHGHEEGRDIEYKPELICRTFAGDSGARPLANGTLFWESPDIWVVAPDGGGVPIAGQVNTVKVHVWNMGNAPAYGVHVDLYWAIPTPGVNMASAHKIEAAAAQPFTLQAGEHRIIDFNWLVVFENGGHECLVAEVYDPISDPVAAHFNPMQDRHVAQQNISEIRVPAGQQINLNFIVPNLSEGMATSELRVEALRGEALQTLAKVTGREFLPETAGARMEISRVAMRRSRPEIDLAAHPVAAVFRETLEPVPQRFVRNLLNRAVMAVPAAPAVPTAPGVQSAAASGLDEAVSVRDETVYERAAGDDYEQKAAGDREEEALLKIDPNAPVQSFRLHPGRELAVTLTITAPEEVRKDLYQAYRVVEMSDGKVTGGLTVLVRLG